jgi:hypothetical protein
LMCSLFISGYLLLSTITEKSELSLVL